MRRTPLSERTLYRRMRAQVRRNTRGTDQEDLAELDPRLVLSRRTIATATSFEIRDKLTPEQLVDYYNARCVNTVPEDYLIGLGAISSAKGSGSRSDRIGTQLQHLDRRILPGRGFHRAVADAIFGDAMRLHYMDDEEYAIAVYARAVRRWGKRGARVRISRAVGALVDWNECRFIPDAYLLDQATGTVVCYEIEDTHPLDHRGILAYGQGWWVLNEIYWDLHLIAYDIYGHHRIYRFPEADLIAEIHDRDKDLSSR